MASTDDRQVKTKVTFKVNNFSDIDAGDVLGDPFSIGSEEWRVYIKIENIGDCPYLGVYGQIMNSNIRSTGQTFPTKFWVYIVGIDGQPLGETFSGTELLEMGDWFGKRTFAKVSELLDQSDKYLPNNTLTVNFDIFTSLKAYNEWPLRRRHEKSYNNKLLSDCLFVVGDKPFYASKAVLSAESDVFDREFTADMLEKTTGVAVIDDIDPNVFEQFHQFLYLGKAEHLEDMVKELLYVSNKYMVSELKTICENLYFLRINPKNAFEVMEVMDKYGNNELKAKAIEYMKDNAFECLKTCEWREWTQSASNHKELKDQMLDLINTKSRPKKSTHTMAYSYLI